MIDLISDRKILDKFIIEFTNLLEKYSKYVVVSGFVAISNARSRGTEDIDLIVEEMSFTTFNSFFKDLYNSNFECIQSDDVNEVYNNYLLHKEIIRFAYKDTLIPNIEFKFPKNKIDEYTLSKRIKLPLTGLDIYFATIESTIAYKEHYLCGEKDYEDAYHLRKLYTDTINLEEIELIKRMIDKYLYNKVEKNGKLKENIEPIIYFTKRDKSHLEFIDKWVEFVKTHPYEEWKKQHSDFLDSQIIHSMEFYQRLLKEPDGAKKIRNIMGWNKKTPYWFEK